MRRTLTPLLYLALLAAPATLSGQDAEAAIAEIQEKWIAGYNAGDAAAVAALYTEDAMLLPPNSEPVEGRDAIRAYWQSFMDQAPGSTVNLTTEEVHAPGGDMAVEVGGYVSTGPDGGHLDHGTFMVLYKKTDGGWKMYRDAFNSSM